MVKKLFTKLSVLSLFLSCLICSDTVLGQQVTLGTLTNGLASGSISAGSQHQAIYGFSVSVSGGSKIFDQYNLTSSHTTQNFMANGTLYRLTNNNGFNYTTNRGVAVGNVIFNGQTITMSGFTENISSTTYYYYLVIDAINTINGYSVQTINAYGANLAHDVNGVNYPLNQSFATSYDFTTATPPYPLTVVNQTGGLASASTTITASTSALKLYKFTVTNNSSSTTVISGFNINSSATTISSYFTGFKLYANSSDSFPGSSTASGTASTSYVGFTGLSESIASGATKYYWLVADCPSSPTLGNVQFKMTDAQSSVAITTSTPSSSYNNFTAFGNTYNINSAVVTITSQQASVSSGTLTAGQTDVVLFGFGVSSAPNISISQFNINSNGAASTYFGNGKLYRCPTSTYSTGSRVLVGNALFNGSFANVTLTSAEAITNTAKYYFLVADNIGADAAQPTIAFNFMSGQTTSAVIQSSPVSSSYNNFAITGNTFTIPAPTIVFSANSTGFTQQTTIVKGQSAVLYAFTAKPIGNVTITSPYIDVATGANPIGFFTGLQLWVSTTGTFVGATQVAGTSFGNGASGIKLTMASPLNLTSGTSYSYYIVGTLQANSNLPLNYAVGVNGIISDNSANDFPTAALTSKNYYLTTASVTIIGNNSTLAGITQGSLSYGQKDIVLFGFKLTAQGDFTIDKMSIPSSNNMNSYFTNGKVYRSTSSTFSTTTATQIAAATANFGSGAYVNLGTLGQTFTAASSTTYYYYLIADLTASNDMTPTTVQYNFTTNQSPKAINDGSGAGDAFNGFVTTDGKNFSIVTSYIWTGSFDDSFNDARNFTDIKGNTVTSISSTGVITVAVNTYTRAPVVKASVGVGGITFGNTPATPTLTINSGFTLTMNTALTLVNGTSATITGPGLLSLSGTAASAIGNGSTLTLSGTTLTNLGTFTAAPTSVINLVSNGNITNTSPGTFTLSSNSNGSAAIGQISGTSAVTGSIIVERYVSGGSLSYRGYRLFSSPVNQATANSNRVSTLAYLKTGAYLTGTTGTGGGFDATSTSPTIFFYREDKTPTTGLTTGNFRGVNKINNGNLYDFNLDNETGTFNLPVGNGYMFFFRGNRATNQTTSTTAIPDPVTFVQTGNLNQGDVTVKNWYTPTSGFLGYRGTAGLGTISGATGYNLVGNPYASTIDWSKFSASTASAAIYGPLVSTTIYTYNVGLKRYETHNGSTGTTNGSKFILSGQGFYVLASSALASLKFTEAAKAPTQQVTGNFFLMGTPVEDAPQVQFLRLQLSKDSLNSEDVVLQFNKAASDGYVFSEDSPYLRGSNAVSFSTNATDNKDLPLTISQIPFPKKRSDIPLNVIVNSTGLYQINMNEAQSIPKMFDVWLKDAYTKDSLDIKNNRIYNFNVNTADATSSDANRFTIVIRPNAAYSYHLLDFVATKQTSSVQTSWKVENEENYTYFTVERSTNGGKTFEVLGSATGKSLATYSLADKAPVIGENQYRLKQEDYFGTVTYSKVVTVMYTPAKNIVVDERMVSVYPNPTNASVSIAVKATGVGAVNYSISITNTSGRIVKTLTSAQPTWQGSVSDLLPGTYFIQVTNIKDNSVVGNSTFIKI